VIKKNLEAVKALIEGGAPIDEMSLSPVSILSSVHPDRTALRIAVYEACNKPSKEGLNNSGAPADLSIIRTLLQHKADPNIVSNNDATLLEVSIFKRNAELCTLLLQAKADINAKHPERNNLTLLEIETSSRSPDHGIIKSLLALKADPNLCFPSYMPQSSEISLPTLKFIEEISSKTADRDIPPVSSLSSYAERPTTAPSPLDAQPVAAISDKISALHQAVANANYPVFLSLLASRADPLASNLGGITLESAAKTQLDSLKLFHKKISRKSKHSSSDLTSPLHMQLLKNKLKTCQKISDTIAKYKSNRELGFAYCLDEKKIDGS
jgi:ankyrin repeat protein